MNRYVTAALDGGLGGGVGTVAMSGVMLATQRAGLMGKQPPKVVTETALGAAGADHMGPSATNALAVAAHFAFGIGYGAIFGLVDRRLRLPLPGAVRGALSGLVGWALSYKGWMPALGILPPPEQDRPGRPQSMILSHLAYGAALGATVDRLER